MISSSNLFIYSYFGQTATENFLIFGSAPYEAAWIDLPPNLKPFILMIIRDGGIPLQYHGFNLAYLNLTTYTKVHNMKAETNLISKMIFFFQNCR